MQKSECIQLLRNQYLKNPKQKNNLSKLTNQAWWIQKDECLSAIGGFSEIRPTLNNFESTENEHSAPNKSSNSTSCQEQLINTFRKDFSQKSNLSKLTSKARWEQKNNCLKELWGYNQLSLFLKNIENNYTEQYEAQLAETTKPKTGGIINNHQQASKEQKETQTWTTQSIIETPNLDHVRNITGQIWMYAFYGLLWFISIWITTWIIKSIMKYIYSFYNTKRMTFIKVLLPKSDGKSDREQEKEIAKDMKEKIWRMSQLYNGLHKISELSTWEKLMHRLFGKQKIVFIYQYEEGQLSFIVGSYPEYQNIIESAISAQYPTCSLEKVSKPKVFQKKYYDIMPLEPKRDPVYTIRTFKQTPDDPINNLIDTMSKVSVYDTVSVILTIKPEDSSFNAKRQKAADRLYKGLDLYSTKWRHWKNLINPFKWISFLIHWPNEKLISNKQEENVGMVRMVRAKEDSMNTIGEEAGNPSYKSGLIVISSSDIEGQARQNLKAMESAYNVYSDEYSNSLEDDNTKHDIFSGIYIPLWKIAANFYLSGFFYKHSYFSTNELSSLYHFADSVYNRSPIIEWMQYKVLPCPANLPQFTDEEWNGKLMTGILAEKYKKGNLSEILNEYKQHRSVSSKVLEEEKETPLADYQLTHPDAQLEEKDGKLKINDHQIIEKEGQKFVKELVPGKTVNGYKLYKDAILLGVNIYRNNLTPVYMKREDRTRHHYMIGKSGTWKSVFLQTMARQDLWNGDGICLIDPHGDLAEDMLAFVPKERAKDVVYFDAGNEDRPMGLNLYEINSLDEADRTVNDATEIFLKMFGPEIFGPRIQEYFKYGSLTILEDFEDRPTLLDVVRLFTDEAYRELKVAKVTNAVVKNWRERTYNAMGDREKAEIIPYFSSKFVSFNTNRLIRNIIGQTKSAFNFDDIMNNQKILIVNLSKGKIWELNAQLLGMILVSKIYNAAMGRAKMDPKDRKDFYLYVDEFQNFVSGTFADILSEARKYRLGLIMAHQYIAQLEPPKGLGDSGGGKSDVKAAVFGNVGTMMSFKIGAPDAEFMEKEYAPLLGPQDIVGIANYKSYIKLNIDNATSKVFSMNSIYTKDYQNKKIVPLLQEYSAKKYGRAREFVDAEISTRLGVGADLDQLPEGNETSGEESSE